MKSTNLILPALGVLSLLGGIARPAQAQAFTNGLPNQLGGNEMTQWMQADEFDLTAPLSLSSIEFWDLEDSNSYQGSVSWTIYSNNDGTPGTILDLGNSDTVNRAATGESALGFTEYTDTLDLPTYVLPAGDYWLGLHNGLLGDDTDQDFYWENTSSATAISPGQESLIATGSPYAATGSTQAFALNSPLPKSISPASVAVPEPSAFAMLGLGLIPFALIARRRLAHSGN